MGTCNHSSRTASKVHAACQTRKHWRHVTKVRVSILGGRWADQKSLRTLAQVCAAHGRIGQTIASFLPSYLTPWVHPKELLPLGRQRGNFLDAAVGDLASTKRRNGFRAVMLISQEEVWDERAAAQDIQCDTHFSNDCWHIVCLYHRCRRLAGTESPAESWFSALKLLYDPRHGPGIGSLAERLQLRIAGLRGNGADDEVVQKIASHVASMDPRNTKTMEGFQKQAILEWKKRPLCFDQEVALPSARGHKLRKQASLEKKNFEKAELESGSKKLLEKHQRRWRLPLYASTRKQWDADLAHDTSQGDRAQTWRKGSSKGSSNVHVRKSVKERHWQGEFHIFGLPHSYRP